ncbi:mesaconyl-C4 CoA hydratase [Homoserinimonas hongtaonis]|uniref:mesaconyl-C4 CoA hydratase n=1 Tax=Homoserinimonas hongtaonis TaxID=2079791 RepID=UPI000D3BABC7|nr:mesaconyl-C4 CoA hydratase [Salinibacterium hongtaonis]AWB90222.1 mesaconyl-C4 CoA hydratase [Salinibacterium hongtaonis]
MTTMSRETVRRTEVIAAEPLESLAAMLELDMPCGEGAIVPPLWHWMYLLERTPQSALGEDGHPVVGIPAPPGPGRRRMFGGGRVTSFAPLRVGIPATKVISLHRSVDKVGKSGPLTLTTVLHEIFQDGELAIREEQDIVYRAEGGEALSPAKSAAPAADGPRLQLDVDERFLFRFSALTYNAHRIHYDRDWCAQEGYDGLVIHGPLLALLAGELYRREGVDLSGKTFSYRLVSPLTKSQRCVIVPSGEGLAGGVEARGADGTVAAVASLADA